MPDDCSINRDHGKYSSKMPYCPACRMYLPSYFNILCRVADDYADMNRDELIKLIVYLRERLEEADFARKESDRHIFGLTDRISELTGQIRTLNEGMSAMAVQVSGQMKQLKEKDRKIAELQSTVKAGRKNLSGHE